MEAGSWDSKREAFEWHEAKPSTLLASRVLSQLPKCILNSIDAQLNHGPFLLEHCHCHFIQFLVIRSTRKLTKYKILQNRSEGFYLLNASTRFDRCMGVRLSSARHTKSARKIASYVLKQVR